MDEEGFISFMKRQKKSARTMQRYLACVKNFAAYLAECGKTLENCDPGDIREGAQSAEGSSFSDYLGLANYFEFTGNEPLSLTSHELFSIENVQKFALKDFLDVNQDYVAILKARGIVTVPQMLQAGRTPGQRVALSQETGIPEAYLLELVKLSDQARIGGHRRIRARLYHEAGLDTLDKIAACEPGEIIRILSDYIKHTGFAGIPPTPKEAANTVAMARHLPRIIEY